MRHLKRLSPIIITLLLCYTGLVRAIADTIVMSNGSTIPGSVIQTNGNDILILTRCAAFNFSKTSIKEIKPAPPEGTVADDSALPSFQKAILLLSGKPWAANLTPIPATVIDRGILRNVPYTSLRSGDYEVNVYGEMEHPAGIEIGVYRKLLGDDDAKSNCVQFIVDILGKPTDKEIVQTMNRKKDSITRNGLTFEITPPTDEDSYNGWWVSVYSEKQLNLARASDAEMSLISVTQAGTAKDVNDSTNFAAWSASELNQARPVAKRRITFVNSSGMTVRDAEVVRVNDGVSLIWRSSDGNGGGLVKMADLPEDLRAEFGYDEAKANAAAEKDKADKERWRQEALANAQAAQAAQAADPQADPFDSGYSGGGYGGGGYSGGGRVYVHGYTRSNGTYVHAYTRSYPHSRR